VLAGRANDLDVLGDLERLVLALAPPETTEGADGDLLVRDLGDGAPGLLRHHRRADQQRERQTCQTSPEHTSLPLDRPNCGRLPTGRSRCPRMSLNRIIGGK